MIPCGCCPVIALLAIGDLHCWWSPPWLDHIPQLFSSLFSSRVVWLTTGGSSLSWFLLLGIGMLDLDSLEFPRRSRYDLYAMLWLWNLLVKPMLLDSLYREKVKTACTICTLVAFSSANLLFQTETLAEIFGNPPPPPGTCTAVPEIWPNICEFNCSTFFVSWKIGESTEFLLPITCINLVNW